MTPMSCGISTRARIGSSAVRFRKSARPLPLRIRMGQRICALLLSSLVVGCGSDDAAGSAGGPDVPLGETKAIDGAGSPASWLLLDKPFLVRDFAAASGQQ